MKENSIKFAPERFPGRKEDLFQQSRGLGEEDGHEEWSSVADHEAVELL